MCLVINVKQSVRESSFFRYGRKYQFKVKEVLTSFGARLTIARVTSLTIANVRSICILAIGVGVTDVGKRRAFVDIYV